MGEINLIPGQQGRGKNRTDQTGSEAVEYTQPKEEKFPAPSLIPKTHTPAKEGWWQRRKIRQAEKQVKREAERVAQAKALVVSQAPAPAPARPLAVDVNLLPHGKSVQAAPRVKSAPLVQPIQTQAEPDFLSDAGFKSHSFPPSEAYSIRRTKRPVPKQIQKKKEHSSTKHSERHEPIGEPADLLDVNLIPKEFGRTDRPKHSFIELIWYGMTSALIVGAVYGGLKWYEFNLTQKSSDLQQEVAKLDNQIASYNTERQSATELQIQLQGLSTIISQHVTYDQLFSFLEENTLPSVYYQTMNIDSRQGKITTSAVTANFEQLRAQEAVFQEHPLVTDVTITSATRTIPTTPTGEDEVVVENLNYPLLFSLSLSVDTSLFHP